MLLEERILRKCGVGSKEVVDGVASGADEGLVIDDGRHTEVEGSTLLQPLNIARSAQTEVGFGNLEAVGGAAHGAYAFL